MADWQGIDYTAKQTPRLTKEDNTCERRSLLTRRSVIEPKQADGPPGLLMIEDRRDSTQACSEVGRRTQVLLNYKQHSMAFGSHIRTAHATS